MARKALLKMLKPREVKCPESWVRDAVRENVGGSYTVSGEN